MSVLSQAWNPEPAVLAGAVTASALFAQGFLRLRRRGRRDHASWPRALLFAGALALAVLPLVSPLDAAGDSYLLSAHMLEHVLIGDAAPALLVAAVRGPLLLFVLPTPILASAARSRPLRAIAGRLLDARISLAAWAVTIGAWHIPAAYDYTLTHPLVHALEHASFMLAGFLVWYQLLDPRRRSTLTTRARLTVALVLFGMAATLAAVLAFNGRPLYPAYASQPRRLLGLSPLLDQQLAGALMAGEQLLSLGGCAIFLLLPTRRARIRTPAAGAATPRPTPELRSPASV